MLYLNNLQFGVTSPSSIVLTHVRLCLRVFMFFYTFSAFVGIKMVSNKAFVQFGRCLRYK